MSRSASPLIDFHVHVFPDLLERLPGFASPAAPLIQELRKRARSWMGPYASALHRAQTGMRHVPSGARRHLDQLGALLPLPTLLVESTVADLGAAIEQSGLTHAVVIAHPPLVSNEMVLDACESDPRLIPAVNVPPGTAKPALKLKKYVERGARILKIHTAADGEGIDAPRYQALLKTATDLGLPVILHTGCIHSHLLFKDPEQGHVERFAPWFTRYPETQFILAHMNYHDPLAALDLAEEHANVRVDTSWQPTEIIGEAVRRLGAEKVLFGTDWPLMGQNIAVGLARVRDCVATGMFTQADADLVLGGNAARLLRLGDASPA